MDAYYYCKKMDLLWTENQKVEFDAFDGKNPVAEKNYFNFGKKKNMSCSNKAKEMRQVAQEFQDTVNQIKMNGAMEEYKNWILQIEQQSKKGQFQLNTNQFLSEGCIMLLTRDGFDLRICGLRKHVIYW